MVLFFTSNAVTPSTVIYMGRDKVENVWFHVDKLSSAHVYLRMTEGMSWESIPEALLTDCAQLVKANSIEGNKKDNLTVIYTPADNLKKTGDMAVGQVSFHNDKKVKRVYVTKRENAIVNRLNKTKDERVVDHEQERIDRIKKRTPSSEQQQQRSQRSEKAARSYDSLFNVEEDESLPRKTGRELEEDFM
ncbi:cytoplasmic protein [Pholiota molesta]|nr:cytoplasmic protein [Pholiota molesta]